MIRDFIRAVLGKNRPQVQALVDMTTDAYDRNQRAVAHFNRAMEIHKMIEARRALQRREHRMLSHGARSFKGNTL